ncbi:hypothetical protein QE152_g26491 [Popillia japonica]|uniref:Uncharacterized protein n=1 Tax=Popillia japonica TaxID=7064 RepID=A0AAW1JX34_POPJA
MDNQEWIEETDYWEKRVITYYLESLVHKVRKEKGGLGFPGNKRNSRFLRSLPNLVHKVRKEKGGLGFPGNKRNSRFLRSLPN